MYYKNYAIEKLFSGFIVYYNGDELFFDTIKEAKAFINEISK